MAFYLTLHTKYNQLQIAFHENNQLIETIDLSNKFSSANLIPTIDALLKNRAIRVSDLSFIGVNIGPAPFTSLRTTISTANGISFASNIPLVGVCAIDILLTEQIDNNFDINIALLNAFSNDVYYAISNKKDIKIGVENIEKLLENLSTYNQKINFFGNGVEIYKYIILEKLNGNAHLKEDIALECDVLSVAKAAYHKWQKREVSDQILPLYIKQYSAQIKY